MWLERETAILRGLLILKTPSHLFNKASISLITLSKLEFCKRVESPYFLGKNSLLMNHLTVLTIIHIVPPHKVFRNSE
jgi:hypothetical protein